MPKSVLLLINLKNSQRKLSGMLGFSIVELMVVVAIIGILATLVIPMYDRLSYKAKESGAKLLLSGLHTAEKTFYSEFQAYHSSFQAIGYSPEGATTYNVGFGSDGVGAGPTNGYNSTVTPGMFNTFAVCDYEGRAVVPYKSCLTLKGYKGAYPPVIDPTFTVNSTVYNATAITVAPDWLAGVFHWEQHKLVPSFAFWSLATPANASALGSINPAVQSPRIQFVLSSDGTIKPTTLSTDTNL